MGTLYSYLGYLPPKPDQPITGLSAVQGSNVIGPTQVGSFLPHRIADHFTRGQAGQRVSLLSNRGVGCTGRWERAVWCAELALRASHHAKTDKWAIREGTGLLHIHTN